MHSRGRTNPAGTPDQSRNTPLRALAQLDRSPSEVDMDVSATSLAKNTETKRAGFSPSQALMGRDQRLPEIILGEPDQVAAHSSITLNESLRRRAEIRAAACAAFHQVALEQTLDRASQRRSRPYRGDFSPGSKVCFFRPEDKIKNEKPSMMHGIII